jgi:hypothetical protein
MKQGYNFGLFVRGKGGNDKIAAATINLGSTKGRGSSTRMFNYCRQTTPQPWNCINQFITITPSLAPPTPSPTSDTTILVYISEQGQTVDWEGVTFRIDNTLPSYSYTAITSFIPASEVPSNNNLTEVTIGNIVTSIGNNAFFSCTNFSTVTFTSTSSLTSIGINAFRGSGLTSIIIPNLVTSIGNNAFENCTSLSSVTFTSTSSLTSISNDMFNRCTSLSSIEIPDSVTTIGNSAFRNSGLTSIIIPNSVTTILPGAFENCTDLLSVTFTPTSTLTIINSYVFYGCSSLTSIIIPNSVTIIGNEAFRSCTTLSSVTIGNSVTDIYDTVFYDCTALTSITIPNSVTYISSDVFVNSGLTTVTIANGQIISGTTFLSPDNDVSFFGATVSTITP